MKKLVLLLALSLALAPALRAELKLPAIIGDHMVLQQNQSNPIWGWDTPGAEITISLAGQSLSTKAGSDGTASLSHIQRPPRSSRGSEITKKAVVVAAESAIVTLNESLWFPKSGELSNTWAFLLFPAILWANSNRSSDASEIVFLRGIRSVVEELPSSHNLPKPNFLYLLSRLDPLLAKAPPEILGKVVRRGIESLEPSVSAFCRLIDGFSKHCKRE